MKILRLNSAVAALLVTATILTGATGCASDKDAKDAGESLQEYHDAALHLAMPSLKRISSRSTLKQQEPAIAKLVDLDASTDAGIASSMRFFSVMKGLAEGASLRYEFDSAQIKVDGDNASVPDKAVELYIAGEKDLPSKTTDETKFRLNKVNGHWLIVLDGN